MSFYLLEVHVARGGGESGVIALWTDVRDLEHTIKEGFFNGTMFLGAHVFQLRTIVNGQPSAERSLFPFVSVKFPGLTECRVDPNGTAIGATVEAGGAHAEVIGKWWDGGHGRLDTLQALTQRGMTMDDVAVTVNWQAIALPPLSAPLLRPGQGVIWDMDDDSFVAVDTRPDNVDDDGVIDPYFDLDEDEDDLDDGHYRRYLEHGHNAP